MRRVQVSELAREMGVPSEELVRVAGEMGLALQGPSDILDPQRADALKSAIQGLVLASRARQKPTSPQASTELVGQTTVSHSATASPNGAQSLLLVNMVAHNVRVSEHFERGFNNMLKVIAALLADARQTVRTKEETVPWGDMYFLRADQSTPELGYIELEYGDASVLGFSQRQKGLLGDIWWSAAWLNESWTRPLEKLGMAIGMVRDPEADYRNQLASDLKALAAQGLLTGVEEWLITTGGPGRNLYLSPKPDLMPARATTD